MITKRMALPILSLVLILQCFTAQAQEARQRWEIMSQIRRDKFDLILPKVMRENNIDMWITVMREGNYGPLYHDLGEVMFPISGITFFLMMAVDGLNASCWG